MFFLTLPMQVFDLGFNLIQFEEFFDVRAIFDEILKKNFKKSWNHSMSFSHSSIAGFGLGIQSDKSHTNDGL